MKEFSIYIHIPFCISKCKYCDFNSYANCDEMIEPYINSVINQIENDNHFTKDNICKTIYIGGGTPSYIDGKYIVKILNMIYTKYTIYEHAEITIEINPSSITYDKLQDYKDIGINRLSIGLQTTNDELLSVIGRRHTYSQFLSAYKMCRDMGFDNINIDIMFGLPNQSINDVEKDISEIIKLNPNHISCYSLILYENVSLYNMVKNNKYILPNENDERKMSLVVDNLLKEYGYEHYEISNYAKDGAYSNHNLMCWNQYEYIGFGAGAHSFARGVRFCNTENIKQYIKNNQINILEEMNKEELMKEYLMLGMRLINRIDKKRFYQLYNVDMLEKFSNELTGLQEKGYINIDKKGQISLTKRGEDFNNYICEQFI